MTDGKVTALTVNAIGKVIYSQCDPDGNDYILLDELINIKHTTDAFTLDQQTTVNGTTSQHKSMKGWFNCCRWKDGSTSWERMSNFKESHPVQVDEFTIQMGVTLEPGFTWWVFCVPKKRDAIISLMKHHNVKYFKRTHK